MVSSPGVLGAPVRRGHRPRRLAGAAAAAVAVALAAGVVTPVAAAAAPPSFEHVTVTAGSATAYVQKNVAVTGGATIRIVGEGWQNEAGTGGSTVALKLNGPAGQYQRTGSGIIEHPSAPGDTTIWALISPTPEAGHPHQFAIGAGGSFDITIDAPSGLSAGQLLSVTFQSGRFADGDTQRAATSDPLVVGGVVHVPPDDEDDEDGPPIVHTGTQYTGVSDPSVTFYLPATVKEGSPIVVSGKGWKTTSGTAGSVIALKFDDGAVNTRLVVINPATGVVQTNKSIVGVVKANKAGDWRIELPFPNGFTADQTFRAGETHSVRLLTGSLLAGDKIRSESAEFTVTAKVPTATFPDVPLSSPFLDAVEWAVTNGITNGYSNGPSGRWRRSAGMRWRPCCSG